MIFRPADLFLFLYGGDGVAWDVYFYGAQLIAAGEVEGLQVVAAEGKVGGGGVSVFDQAQ